MPLHLNDEWAPNQQDEEPTDQMLIKAAQARGYTRELWVDVGCDTLNVLVRPGTDLDARFRAFDLEDCTYIRVTGWLCTTEEA